VGKVLAFEPELTETNGDAAEGQQGMPITAKVAPSAAEQGVPEFVFTCGQHPVPMKSLPFLIKAKDGQPDRTLNIKIGPGLHWLLETAQGDVQVDVD
jgi:hypothetical protein